MNKKLVFITGISLFLYCVVIFVPLDLYAQKITVRKEKGVTVVTNPKEPAPSPGTPVKLVIKEELSIGKKQGDQNYMFLSARALDVDNSGNIYVLDSKAGNIKVFNADGSFVQTVGKKGKGPGETDRPRDLQITPQGEILVSDMTSRQILFFDLKAKYLRKISIAKLTFFQEPKVDSKNYIVASYMLISNDPSVELKKFNTKMEPIFDIYSLEWAKPPIIDARFPRFYWQIIEGDSLIWGVNIKYELQVMSAEGKLIKKIVKDYDPVPITKAYKEKWMKDTYGEKGPMPGSKFKWGKHHLAFRDLRCDDEGRVFIQTYEKIGENQGGYYDVFDAEGRYIAKVFLEVKPLVWEKNKMYTIFEDEDGFHFVKRFTVEWK